MTVSGHTVVFAHVALICQCIVIISMTGNISVSVNCQGMDITDMTVSCQNVGIIAVVVKCQLVVLINVTAIVTWCVLHQYDYALSKCSHQ